MFRRSFGPRRSSFRPSHSSFSPNRSRCSRSRSRSRRSRSSFRPSHSSFTKEASRHSIDEVINWEASRRGAGGLSALLRCGGVLGGRLWKVAESKKTYNYFLIYGVDKTVFERFGAVQKHWAGHTNLFRRSFTRLGLTRHQEVHFQCSSSRRRRSSSSGKNIVFS